MHSTNTLIRKCPILISGSHRSGSTWVGKMLDLSDNIAYIHEPFRPNSSLCESTFNYWFTYVNQKNEDLYKDCIASCLDFSYPIKLQVRDGITLKKAARLIRDKMMFYDYKWNGKRPLIKDPISVFSAEWLYLNFDMLVIAIIRHPAAFVGSLKKAQWYFPFDHLIKQPLLIKELLKEYEEKIMQYANNPPDIIDQGILLWNMIHSVIFKFQEKYSDEWLFVRHEDLSAAPVQEFEKIYNRIGLSYTSDIKKAIMSYTSSIDEPTNLKRNSKSNIWSWKERLSKDEIFRIRKETEEIASNYYSSEDW